MEHSSSSKQNSHKQWQYSVTGERNIQLVVHLCAQQVTRPAPYEKELMTHPMNTESHKQQAEKYKNGKDPYISALWLALHLLLQTMCLCGHEIVQGCWHKWNPILVVNPGSMGPCNALWSTTICVWEARWLKFYTEASRRKAQAIELLTSLCCECLPLLILYNKPCFAVGSTSTPHESIHDELQAHTPNKDQHYSTIPYQTTKACNSRLVMLWAIQTPTNIGRNRRKTISIKWYCRGQ